MMTAATKAILLTAALALLAAGVVSLDWVTSNGASREHAWQFQRMAGGLGLGATVRPRWCFINFDPRLEPCTCSEYPLAGGYCYCPEHTGTVSYFESAPAKRP
jgi:hypothetical protein